MQKTSHKKLAAGKKEILRRRSGLPLIDLLVAIAIIAILAAVLLPALASAENEAQRLSRVKNSHKPVAIKPHRNQSS